MLGPRDYAGWKEHKKLCEIQHFRRSKNLSDAVGAIFCFGALGGGGFEEGCHYGRGERGRWCGRCGEKNVFFDFFFCEMVGNRLKWVEMLF